MADVADSSALQLRGNANIGIYRIDFLMIKNQTLKVIN